MRGQVLLLESGRHSEANLRSRLVSLLLHTGLIALVLATAEQQAITSLSKPEEHKTTYKVELPPPVIETPRTSQAPLPSIEVPKGHQVIIAPIDIPDQLPKIDLGRAVTNADDYSGTGVPGGRALGKEGLASSASAIATPGKVFSEHEVSEQAVALSGKGSPRYPDILRQAGVEGGSILEFTVDTSGRVLMNSVNVVSETHPLFSQAGKNALLGMRFIPAKVGEQKVPQRVRLPFSFNISREEESHRSP